MRKGVMSRMTTWFPELKNPVFTLANCFRSGGSQGHKFTQDQRPILHIRRVNVKKDEKRIRRHEKQLDSL
jgi:hypothetical protein